MHTLTAAEVEEVSGGFLPQIGMGMAGMTMSLAAYSINAGITGNHSNATMIGAAVAGMVWGVGGLNNASGLAGAAIGAAVEGGIEDRTDS